MRAHVQEQRSISETIAACAYAAGQRPRDEAGRPSTTVCSGPDTTTIARGATVRRAAMVLCGLLERSADTNRELAKALDRARIAGPQCEREYGTLIQLAG